MEPKHRVVGGMLRLAQMVDGRLIDRGTYHKLLVDIHGIGRDVLLTVDETTSPPRLALQEDPSEWAGRVASCAAEINAALAPQPSATPVAE